MKIAIVGMICCLLLACCCLHLLVHDSCLHPKALHRHVHASCWHLLAHHGCLHRLVHANCLHNALGHPSCLLLLAHPRKHRHVVLHLTEQQLFRTVTATVTLELMNDRATKERLKCYVLYMYKNKYVHIYIHEMGHTK